VCIEESSAFLRPRRACVGIRCRFYNLFLACGMIAGVIAWMNGNETVGNAGDLHLHGHGSGAIVLVTADRLGFGGERGKSITGALAEGLPTLIALLASLI
jgi:putative membrane protein